MDQELVLNQLIEITKRLKSIETRLSRINPSSNSKENNSIPPLKRKFIYDQIKQLADHFSESYSKDTYSELEKILLNIPESEITRLVNLAINRCTKLPSIYEIKKYFIDNGLLEKKINCSCDNGILISQDKYLNACPKCSKGEKLHSLLIKYQNENNITKEIPIPYMITLG